MSILFLAVASYHNRVVVLTKRYFDELINFAMYLCGRECKIIRDQQTLKSKGYGFVSFVNKEVRFGFYYFLLIL